MYFVTVYCTIQLHCIASSFLEYYENTFYEHIENILRTTNIDFQGYLLNCNVLNGLHCSKLVYTLHFTNVTNKMQKITNLLHFVAISQLSVTKGWQETLQALITANRDKL